MSVSVEATVERALDRVEDRVFDPLQQRLVPLLRRGQARAAHRLARRCRDHLRTRVVRTLPLAEDCPRRVRLLRARAAAERLLLATRRELHAQHAGTARHAPVSEAEGAWCCRHQLAAGEQAAELATALAAVEHARHTRRVLHRAELPVSLLELPQVPELLAELAADDGMSSAARRAEEVAKQLALGVGEHAAAMVRALYVG